MAHFNSFSAEALEFLRDLASHNTKEWFAANKATYEAHLKTPGKDFADAMTLALRALTDIDHSSKIFRIHRDVRFSKDKTPYNAHLHVAFTPTGQTGQPPMWFFGLSPDKLSLGCGVFQYAKETLTSFRTAMAGSQGADLMHLTATLRSAGIRIGEPDLRRVPAGFDKDHPHEEALRRKGFAAWIDIDDPGIATEPELVDRVTTEFRQLMPVFDLLRQVT